MEIKKSPKADLERGRGRRFLVSLLLVLSVGLALWLWPGGDVPLEAMLPPTAEPVWEEDLPSVQIERPAPVLPTPQTVVEGTAASDQIEVVADAAEVQELLRRELLADIFEADDPADVERLAAQPLSQAAASVDSLDRLPTYPGGDAACMRFLGKQVRYPALAAARRLTGRVLVQFVVTTDGGLTDIRIREGIHPLLDREALRVVRLMPRWVPGRWRGRPSPFLYVLPVEFRL